MPTLIPRKTPPRPLTGFDISQKPTLDELIGVVRNLTKYVQTLVLFNEQVFAQLRDACNWAVVQQPIRNLVPDSDLKDPTLWSVGPGWTVAAGVGVGGGPGFYLSTDLPGVEEEISTQIAIPPAGGYYVLSGWLDLTNATGGTVAWVAYDPVNLVDLAVIVGNNRTAERVQVGLNVSGITAIDIRLRSTDVTVSGAIVGSQPQLELPGQGIEGQTQAEASLYRSNVGAN